MLAFILWTIAIFTAFAVLAYHKASLKIWATSVTAATFLLSGLTDTYIFFLIIFWVIAIALVLIAFVDPIRYAVFQPILNAYRKALPPMSRTEREALAAGTVSWEGDLFNGEPDWHKLIDEKFHQLTDEEKAFLNGPVEEVCAMVNTWRVTHKDYDLSPETWQYLKDKRFWALVLPKKYGGLEFSQLAHSAIIEKATSHDQTLATIISVPNSLGPAELIIEYGTDNQKNYYLPRLATGEEIPCFALTGPHAGSDASSMQDYGVVCKEKFNGTEQVCIKLNFDKRYITLAPVATLVGLAFKLYDPNHLLGDKVDLGITCALIPADTIGIDIGRRHLPVGGPFQNGPIHGKDVIIPVDYIIGGKKMAGHGWRMLMESLAVGRAISLPSIANGSAKTYARATGAYARIRKQFGISIGKFEGVEEVLARMAGHIYWMDAVRVMSLNAIDNGAKPAIVSAIAKYHITEAGRNIGNDAMDIHGGKGICLGPRNYLAATFQAIPVGITVEGANILTRNLIIYGQGVVRGHPYLYKLMRTLEYKDKKTGIKRFDKIFLGQLAFTVNNLFRAFIYGLTDGRAATDIPHGPCKHYYQEITRYSTAFAVVNDFALLMLGGELKRKERISARLGDILSMLYIGSAILKRFEEDGQPMTDWPLVRWASEQALYHTQQRISRVCANFPIRWVGRLLRFVIFPRGRNHYGASDRLEHEVAEILMTPSPLRDRLTNGTYLGGNLGVLEEALLVVVQAEETEKKLSKLINEHSLEAYTYRKQIAMALEKQLISEAEAKLLHTAQDMRDRAIAVDDFDPGEFTNKSYQTSSKKHSHPIS